MDWIERAEERAIEKIGKSPDTQDQANCRRDVGRARRAMKPSPKKGKESLNQDTKKGTPLAGKLSPYGNTLALRSTDQVCSIVLSFKFLCVRVCSK